MALTELAPGEIGAVVTYLEMTERPRMRPMPDSPLRLVPWRSVEPAKYRLLFERVGSRWLWFSRLAMDDAALLKEIAEVHAVVDRSGIEVGMIELDFSRREECLIRFLALIPELAGRGHGNWLFAQVLLLAWRQGIKRVHVHTCTLDHPAALPAYLKAGFKARGRAFESFPDPRISGLLPPESAPQIPLIRPGG
ncbi:GNAT family N-acetyltransferase [Sphingosinicella rhizophila]|uniref:GNAT family N-acetyltransferase n=1 Tax=Sphingosinicella rhizophila TaxID=3050082 RepID=A0ABU3Q8W3_9SPHN|nr:GNAT family N-acetyltransferase [Sphingosinicella sp. GR2756]MDT9599842.1 GNAT family N-acetyltransferase [Sphingosinicella sp. GR2756]